MDKVTKDGFRIGLAAMILVTLDQDQSTQQGFVTLIKTAFGLNPNGDHKISSKEIKDFLEKLASDDAQNTIKNILSSKPPLFTDVLERFITKIAGLDNSLFSQIKTWAAEVVLDKVLDDLHDLLKPENIEKIIRELIIADINAAYPGALNGTDIEAEIQAALGLAKQLHDALPRDIDLPSPPIIAVSESTFLFNNNSEKSAADLGAFADKLIEGTTKDGIINKQELIDLGAAVAATKDTKDDKNFVDLLARNGIDLKDLGLKLDGELSVKLSVNRYFDPSTTPNIIITIPREPAAAR